MKYLYYFCGTWVFTKQFISYYWYESVAGREVKIDIRVIHILNNISLKLNIYNWNFFSEEHSNDKFHYVRIIKNILFIGVLNVLFSFLSHIRVRSSTDSANTFEICILYRLTFSNTDFGFNFTTYEFVSEFEKNTTVISPEFITC